MKLFKKEKTETSNLEIKENPVCTIQAKVHTVFFVKNDSRIFVKNKHSKIEAKINLSKVVK